MIICIGDLITFLNNKYTNIYSVCVSKHTIESIIINVCKSMYLIYITY